MKIARSDFGSILYRNLAAEVSSLLIQARNDFKNYCKFIGKELTKDWERRRGTAPIGGVLNNTSRGKGLVAIYGE